MWMQIKTQIKGIVHFTKDNSKIFTKYQQLREDMNILQSSYPVNLSLHEI
jgi:hypothetical protein